MNNKHLPNDIDAEKAILGAILLNNELFEDTVTEIDADDFYKPFHKFIFEGMESLGEQGEVIDAITLKNALKKTSPKKTVDVNYISQLTDGVPSSGNILQYIKVVKEKSILRGFIKSSNQAIKDSLSESVSCEQLLSEQMGIIDNAYNEATGIEVSSFQTGDDMVDAYTEHLDKRIKGEFSFLKTELLDDIIGGIESNDLITIAGHTGTGKTSFAISCISNLLYQGKKVAFLNYEMSKEELMNRLIAFRTGVDLFQFKTGNFTTKSHKLVSEAMSVLREQGLYINDKPAYSLTGIRADCRKLHRRVDIDVIFVDYLQIIDPPEFYKMSDYAITTRLTRFFMRLKKELKVPIIQLSQFSRESKKQHRPPRLDDLKNSGSIEQDSSIVILLYPDVFHDDKEIVVQAMSNDEPFPVVFDVAKQRSGPTAAKKLIFKPKIAGFFTE